MSIIIGCDIGGVIRNQIDNTPIEDSIDTLKELSETSKIIFISKCKEAYLTSSQEWLKSNGLDSFQTFYCPDYKDKIAIASRENVSIMIDDKIQVLKTFNDDIFKIWFCNDSKRILGLKKYQPDIFESINLATNWKEVACLLKEN